MLMEVMLERKMRMSDLQKDIIIYPQLLKNVKAVNKSLAKQDKEVISVVRKDWERAGASF